MKFLWESFLIILSLAFVYLWQTTTLSIYTVPLLGILVFTLILNKINAHETVGIISLVTIVLLLIFSTGALTSPFYFLLYFLGFGIAFVFEPASVFVFAIGIILVFLPKVLQEDLLANIIRVGSLIFISPLAFYFGKEFRRDEKKEEKQKE